jgi:hypothetical protein
MLYCQRVGPVAQLVEHRTFNAVVPGSSPGRLTMILKHLVDLLEFVFARVIAQRLQSFGFNVGFEPPGELLHSSFRHDVISIEDGTCLVTADLHRFFLA